MDRFLLNRTDPQHIEKGLRVLDNDYTLSSYPPAAGTQLACCSLLPPHSLSGGKKRPRSATAPCFGHFSAIQSSTTTPRWLLIAAKATSSTGLQHWTSAL